MTRRRPLLALYTATGLSLGGNAVAAIVIPLYVLDDTGSPLAAGIAGAAATLPVVIGGAFGGVLVDRIGFRRAAIVADVLSGVSVLAIPALATTVGLPTWALLCLVFLGGLFDTPGTTAKSAMVPDLAERAAVALSRPASTMSAVSRLATLLGASLAALLVVLVGPLAALLVTGATFAASAGILLVLVPVVRAEARAPTGYWSELAVGLRYVVTEPVIRGIVLLVVVTNLIDTAGLAVLKPAYARTVSPDGALLGVMVALFAGGAVVGAVMFERLHRRLPRRVLLIGCFMMAGPTTYLGMGLGLPVPVLLVLFALAGLAAGPINPLLSTILYETVPRELRARVLGALSTGVSLGMPIGAVLAGGLVEGIGLTAVLLATGVLYLLVTASPLLGRRTET